MFKKSIKILANMLLFALMLYGLLSYKMIIYGMQQGKGQLNIIKNSQAIEYFLKNESFPDSLKQKLRLIQEIKQFAVDRIGILPNENYSTVYDQQNKPVLYTVTACKPYSFEAKEWKFPFLGKVSYKGFFEKEEADKELRNLKLKGYDVDVYSPTAWSTLGWFRDPILSNMLYKSEEQLCNLILHELTHGTLFVKNDVTFNENLANFIGEKGTALFLANKYGIQSKPYEEYIQSKKDEKIFTQYMLKSTAQLDSLYASTSVEEEKKQQKKEIITKIVRGIKRLPIKNKRGYFRYSLQAYAHGNAFFMNFLRYDSQYESFEKEFSEQYQSNLRDYLRYLKVKYPSL